MLAEAVEGLHIRQDGLYVDCTFGRGGHSQAILERLGEGGRLLAIDRDKDAVCSPEANALSRDFRFQIQQGRYAELITLVEQLGWRGRVAGILMDLGVSSPQLDVAERGFSFLRDGPLDMRMDRDRGIAAAEWLRLVSEQELGQVLRDFGEERYARRIARAIVAHRARQPIGTTKQLASVIAAAIPRWERGKHPATRSFQAIRILVNRELQELEDGLSQTIDSMMIGGRLAVIAFHSLEDRLVKRFMRDESRGVVGEDCWPGRALHGRKPRLKRIGGPRKPSIGEVQANPRARSAILRIAEKLPP